jgi:hypothetical protein
MAKVETSKAGGTMSQQAADIRVAYTVPIGK